MKYKTILADPPWNEEMAGQYKSRHKRPLSLVYPTMSIEDIKKMPVNNLAENGCHLWLWVTNSHLKEGFEVLEAWGFKYLAPITWVKPSGLGNYFIHRTQHILFGYKGKCEFPLERYKPNVIFAPAIKHSRKPEESYKIIESISPEPRLELFARPYSALFPKRHGWHVWGNEVRSDISLMLRSNNAFAADFETGAEQNQLPSSGSSAPVSRG